MKKQSSAITIELDLGDRKHAVCVLDAKGEILKQESIINNRTGLTALHRLTYYIHPIHISKSAIAALTFPAAPAAIIRVVAIGTAHRLARNAARTSFSGGWRRTD